MKINKKIINKNSFFLILIILVVVLFGGFNIYRNYDEYKIKQKFREECFIKGIYEIDNTFGINARNDLYVFFMICDPPSNKEELKIIINEFLQKNNIIEELKNRKNILDGDVMLNSININFVHPSKHFPVGWNNGFENGFFSSSLDRNILVSIYIPWDAKSTVEYDYFFGI